jgi:hypothetical protein
MASRHSQLVKACLDYLTRLGYESMPVKNLATPHVDKAGGVRWSRGLLKPGVSDIIACSPTGHFVAVEVKISPDKLRLEQERFKAAIEARGGLWLEVRDNTQVLLDAHREGKI